MKLLHYFPRVSLATFLISILFGLSFIKAEPTFALGPCFCYGAGNEKSGCGPQTGAECDENSDSLSVFHFEACKPQKSAAVCDKAFSDWKTEQANAPTAASPAPGGAKATKSRFIPDCALENNLPTDNGAVTGECGDVSIFVWLLLNASNYLFAIIGAIALAVFVYGGFLLIISQGNEEKITKGMDAIKAAVIGLVVAFGGYFLIRFLGEAIGLKEAFRLQ